MTLSHVDNVGTVMRVAMTGAGLGFAIEARANDQRRPTTHVAYIPRRHARTLATQQG